jgi:DNA-binding response OmpR family regulator
MIPGNRMRVLLVDDDEPKRDQLRRDLERDGYDVEGTPCGMAGIHKAFAFWPDVIVLFCKAWKAFETIVRANGYLKHMEIIVCHA